MKFLATFIVTAALFLGLAGAGESVSGAATFTAIVQKTREIDNHIVSLKQVRDRHGDVVGWGNTVCFQLGNGSAQCIGTFVLPNGKINVAGTRHNQDFFVLSIVGGTGVYEAAEGTLIANTIEDSPRRERLVFFFA